MELIKPPISARDIYYKAGAILSFSSLCWIQLGPRESAWEAPEASHPKPPPGPSQPLQHGNTTGDGHDAQRCSPNTLKALEHRQGHVTLSSFFSRRFLLLLEALTKISGRYEETQLPSAPAGPTRDIQSRCFSFPGMEIQGKQPCTSQQPAIGILIILLLLIRTN